MRATLATILTVAFAPAWAADNTACKTSALHELVNATNKYSSAEITQIVNGICDPTPSAAKPTGAASPPAADSNETKSNAKIAADAVAADKANAARADASSAGNWAGDKVNIRMHTGQIFHKTPGDAGYAGGPETKFLVTKDDKTDLTVDLRSTSTCAAGVAKDRCLEPDTKYSVAKADVLALRYNKIGWEYGMLVAPFKFHLHDKSLTSSASLGPYMGYSWGNDGFGLTLVGTAGITTLSTEVVQPPATTGASTNASPATNTTTKTSSQTGFTSALGLIWTISKGTGIHAGILYGKDWAGSNATVPYKHEGRPWLSLEIGLPLSN